MAVIDDDFETRLNKYVFRDLLAPKSFFDEPAFYHFLFDSHANRNLGNKVESALAFVQWLLEEYAEFVKLSDTESRFLEALFKSIYDVPTTGSTDTLPEEWPGTLLMGRSAVMLPIARYEFAMHALYIVFLKDILIIVNTGRGGQLHRAKTIYDCYKSTKSPINIRLLAAQLMSGCPSTVTVESWYEYAHHVLAVHCFMPLAAEQYPASLVLPVWQRQRSGSCTFMSLWYALGLVLCNAPFRDDNQSMPYGEVENMQTFCACYAAHTAATTAMRPGLSAHWAHVGSIMRLFICGEHRGAHIRLMFDEPRGHPETVREYLERKLWENPSGVPPAYFARNRIVRPRLSTAPAAATRPHSAPEAIAIATASPPLINRWKKHREYEPHTMAERISEAAWWLDQLCKARIHPGLQVYALSRLRVVAAGAVRECGIEAAARESEMEWAADSNLKPWTALSDALYKAGKLIDDQWWVVTDSDYAMMSSFSREGAPLVGLGEVMLYLLYYVLLTFNPEMSRWQANKKNEIETVKRESPGFYEHIGRVLTPDRHYIHYDKLGDVFPLTTVVAYLTAHVESLPVWTYLGKKRTDDKPQVKLYTYDTPKKGDNQWEAFGLVTDLLKVLLWKLSNKSDVLIAGVRQRHPVLAHTDESGATFLDLVDSLGNPAIHTHGLNVAALLQLDPHTHGFELPFPFNPLSKDGIDANYVTQDSETPVYPSLGDRSVYERRIEFTAAKTLHSLRRLDGLMTEEINFILVSAYGALPAVLPDALEAGVIKARFNLQKMPHALVLVHSAAYAHLQAAARDVQSRYRIRKELHATGLTAARLIRLWGRVPPPDSVAILWTELINAYYNYLASTETREDLDLLANMAKPVDLADDTYTRAASALSSVLRARFTLTMDALETTREGFVFAPTTDVSIAVLIHPPVPTGLVVLRIAGVDGLRAYADTTTHFRVRMATDGTLGLFGPEVTGHPLVGDFAAAVVSRVPAMRELPDTLYRLLSHLTQTGVDFELVPAVWQVTVGTQSTPSAWIVCGLRDGLPILLFDKRGHVPAAGWELQVPMNGGVYLRGDVREDAPPNDPLTVLFSRWLRGSDSGVLLRDAERGEYHIVSLFFEGAATAMYYDERLRTTPWHFTSMLNVIAKLPLTDIRYPHVLVTDIHFCGLHPICLDSGSASATEFARRQFFANADNWDGLVATGCPYVGPRSHDRPERASRWLLTKELKSVTMWNLREMFGAAVTLAESISMLLEDIKGDVLATAACPTFTEKYGGCCEIPTIQPAGTPPTRTHKRSRFQRDRVKETLAKIKAWPNQLTNQIQVLAPTQIDALRVLACALGFTTAQAPQNPWPECVAEMAARSPDVVGKWIYQCILHKIFSETAQRLTTLISEKTAVGAVLTCADLLYAVERIDPRVVDFERERRLPDLLTEMTAGFLMRQQQSVLLDDIADERPGVAHQMIMGGGKTSFIIPHLMFAELLKRSDSVPNVKIVVPELLVPASEQIVHRSTNVLGMWELIYFTGLDEQEKWARGDQLGTATVWGDKTLQRDFLEFIQRHDDSLSIFKDYTEHQTWKDALVICDEVDMVVNPLTCETNIPIGRVATPAADVFERVMRVLRGDASGAANLPEVLQSKLAAATATANELVLDVNYGLLGVQEDMHRADSETDTLVAIPFNGANNPMAGSRFTDLELRLILTYRAYENMICQRARFRERDVRYLVTQLAHITMQWTRGVSIMSSMRTALPYCSEAAIDALAKHVTDGASAAKTATKFSRELATLRDAADRRLRKFFDQYAVHVLRDLMGVYETQYSVGMLEFLSPHRCGQCIMFSGTLGIHTLVPGSKTFIALDGVLHRTQREIPYSYLSIRELKKDTAVEDEVNAVLSGFACAPRVPPAKQQRPGEEKSSKGPGTARPMPDARALTMPRVASVSGATHTDLEKQVIEAFALDSKYDALIDAAGVLRVYDALYYARRIADVTKADVLFVHRRRPTLFVWPGPRGSDLLAPVLVPTDDAIGAPQDRRRVMFYDQKSTFGVDFKQGPRSRGLVVIDRRTTWTAAAQAAFRLRRLTRGHTIDFLFSQEHGLYWGVAVPTPTDLLEMFKNNETQAKATGEAHGTFAIATAALRTAHHKVGINAFRRRLWFDILHPDTLAKTKIARKRLAYDMIINLVMQAPADPEILRLQDDLIDLMVNIMGSSAAAKSTELVSEATTAIATRLTTTRTVTTEANLAAVRYFEPKETFRGAFDENGRFSRLEKYPLVGNLLKILSARFHDVVFAEDWAYLLMTGAAGAPDAVPFPPTYVVMLEWIQAAAKFVRTIFVCSSTDASAMMHATSLIPPGGRLVLYSTTGRMIGLKSRQAFDLLPEEWSKWDMDAQPKIFPKEMRAWCFGHPVEGLVMTQERATAAYAELARLRDEERANIAFIDRVRATLNPGQVRADLKKFAALPGIFGQGVGAAVGHMDTPRCATCGRRARLVCGKCRAVFYCSRACAEKNV